MAKKSSANKPGRIPLGRERILKTALRLADEGGLELLSVRKLAQALGVKAMSLYNHVINRDDLNEFPNFPTLFLVSFSSEGF